MLGPRRVLSISIEIIAMAGTNSLETLASLSCLYRWRDDPAGNSMRTSACRSICSVLTFCAIVQAASQLAIEQNGLVPSAGQGRQAARHMSSVLQIIHSIMH